MRRVELFRKHHIAKETAGEPGPQEHPFQFLSMHRRHVLPILCECDETIGCAFGYLIGRIARFELGELPHSLNGVLQFRIGRQRVCNGGASD